MASVELVILVGIQASGKTTFYRRHLQGDYLHVSLDNWRGKGNVRRKEHQAIMDGLSAAASSEGTVRGVVVDNTNTTVETRKRYFQQAGEFARAAGCGVRMIAYFFDANLAGCLARNTRRPADAPAGAGYYVPPAAIASFQKRLQPPTRAEGFEKILRVRITDEGGFAVDEEPPAQGPP